MNNVICFDRVAEAKSVLKSGVDSTSIRARSELKTAAWYLINRTTYTSRQIEERLKQAASDYFRGMPANYVDTSIREIVLSVEKAQDKYSPYDAPTPITIYKDELRKIEALGHDDTERLAFIFLCAAKMIPYEHIYECNARLFQLAWRYKYDTKNKKITERAIRRRVGGSEPTKRINRLCQSGLLRYSTRINASYKKNQAKDKPTASAIFTVPILQNDGEVAFVINHPDEDSLVLYYDRYKGYTGMISCVQCGKPVFKTGRRQKYCNSCADTINHHPEKRDLCPEIAVLKTP